MDGSFEARLGLAPNVGDKSDRSTSTADGAGEEIDGGELGHESVVLVVMDVNKELNLTAFNWALAHVIQSGDTVKLLGVLHHIVNPMGYRSRADENGWNGASRKVLENQVATHVAMLKSIPAIYTAVERLGAKLDIDVRANPHSKNLVVEEARRLGARYVVIDRHIKKDKKFYIENLTCYVTRVKSMTIFEHLRHGVPVVEDDAEAMLTATETSSVQTPPLSISQEFSNPDMLQATHAPLHHQTPVPSSTGTAVPSIFRPTNSDYHPIDESPGVDYGPELMGFSHQHYDLDATSDRELEVRRWLIDSGYRMEPGYHFPASEYGYLTPAYSAEATMHQIPVALSPFTEAAMANLINASPYPVLYSDSGLGANYSGSHSAGIPPSRESYVRTSIPASSQSVQTEKDDAIASLLQLQLRDTSRNEPDKSNRAPISVQARRADANWPLEFLHSEFGGLHISTSTEETANLNSKGASDDEIDRVSSVRRAVSSKKTVPGTPPLCTVCQQKSPVFGKVKRFTYPELQDATNNFSAENYLSKGGYGTVYKGQLKRGQLVAVKQHKLSSSQGDEEFCAEIEVLSCAQHRNLVTLIGYCVEKQLRLLVYEYVCNGSLDIHLSPKSKTDLRWHHRHKIALGAARALRYLHEECRVGCIVHRDMRPNNILLTHDFTPMVGDFGLARRQTDGDLAEETRVLGTIGYLAPEYAETGQITDKADVYAFGVVLLELLTGRKSIEHSRPKHEVSLVEWARPRLPSYDKELLDPRLKGQYNEYELHCMMHAAIQCIKKNPSERPRIAQVLRILNPPEERDWTYGPRRPIQENLSSSHTPQPTLQVPPPSTVSSGSSSRSSSCSQSDLCVGSHSKPSDQPKNTVLDIQD